MMAEIESESFAMRPLLLAAGLIDRTCATFARLARWALLADAVLIAGNAVSRKVFSVAAPVLFDLQWQFFAAVVLLTGAYALQKDEHVRIDVFTERMGPRGMAWVDIVGCLVVLFPIGVVMVWLTWPQFLASFIAGETRATRESMSNLPAWIIKGFLTLGFALLGLQALAEAIRRLDFLRGGSSMVARRSVFERSNVP